MKFCTKCGNELMDEAVICTKCGCSVRFSAPVMSKAPKKSEAVRPDASKILSSIFIMALALTVFLILMSTCLSSVIFSSYDSYMSWILNSAITALVLASITFILGVVNFIVDLVNRIHNSNVLLGVAKLLIGILVFVLALCHLLSISSLIPHTGFN